MKDDKVLIYLWNLNSGNMLQVYLMPPTRDTWWNLMQKTFLGKCLKEQQNK